MQTYKKLFSGFVAAATMFSSFALVAPVVAAPNTNSPWAPTGDFCAHPSDPGNLESGVEYENAKTGATLCFRSHDGGGSLGVFGGDLGDGHVPDEIVVKFKNDHKPFRVVRLPHGASVAQVVSEYGARADVVFAEPNYIASAYFVPNDPYYLYQWNMDNSVYGGIHAEAAWDVSRGSGAIVAVIDTGIAYENYNAGGGNRYYRAPDLASTCFVAGYDFVNNDAHPNDDNSHGTHVAGTVAQSTNNGVGVAGLAHEACLMPVKVLNKQGSGTYAQVADGIRFAVDNGAHVINLSLGGSVPGQVVEDAVAYAYANGVTVVAAAGNENGAVGYPAAYDAYVIAVGATRYDETRAPYSNFGPSVDVVAPGGDTSVDQNGDGYVDGILQNTFNPTSKKTNDFGYWFFQGTSMAAPHVAGLAALVIANGNATTPDEVRSALEETADDLGDFSRDDFYGWGLVNAPAALAWTSGPVDNAPTVDITSPGASSTVSGVVTITADAADDAGITKVEFYVDGILLGEDTVHPYEWAWDSTAVADGAHTLTVTAYDTAEQTGSDSVLVFVDNVNDPPVANAGQDQVVADADGNGSEDVSLSGVSSSDPDGFIASYEWYEGVTLLATTATPTVTLALGDHTLTLIVTDNGGASASDEVFVSVVESPNIPPVADAGPDQTVEDTDENGTEDITLNGSGSSDADGTVVSYEWYKGATFLGAGVEITVTLPVGNQMITLIVTDDEGATDSDTALVSITSPASTLSPLIVTAYKVKGLQKANLTWASNAAPAVDIYRDGAVIATTENDGAYTDNIDKRGGGSYTYKVCEAGTAVCSNESTIAF